MKLLKDMWRKERRRRKISVGGVWLFSVLGPETVNLSPMFLSPREDTKALRVKGVTCGKFEDFGVGREETGQ